MGLKNMCKEIISIYSLSLIGLGYTVISSFTPIYQLLAWNICIIGITFLIKIWEKYIEKNHYRNNYYFDIERILINFLVYLSINKSLEQSLKKIILRNRYISEDVFNVYKSLRNGVSIRKSSEKYYSNILKTASKIPLYSRKEFLKIALDTINFIRKNREVVRKFSNKMKVINFRLKILGIIISLSLSISCYTLCYVNPLRKVDRSMVEILFSLILSISNFHIQKVFEKSFFNIFKETLTLEIIYFYTIILLNIIL